MSNQTSISTVNQPPTTSHPQIRLKHPVDECPPPTKLGVLSLQHVLAFYAGAVVVPLVLAGGLKLDPATTIHLINADLLTCGIATLIQTIGFWKIGVKLPIVQGVTTTAISPMIAIGLAVNPDGGLKSLPLIYGAVIISGIFTFMMAPVFARLIHFFPPLVIGIVLTTMGVTLLAVSAGDITNWASPNNPINPRDIAYAIGTLVVIIAIQRFFKGFMGTIAVLIGLVGGTMAALALGDISFSNVGTSPWLGVTTPFYFGWPDFGVTASISMIIVMLITMVETTGDVFATGEIVGKRITKKHISAALRADGLSTTLGGIMNSFPYTCFAQNIGLVRLTKVKSRWVVVGAGIIMLLLGLIPKAGALVAAIPHPVLGGASLVLFANLTLVGIQTLSRVDLSDTRNGIILTTSIGLAMLVSFKPDIAKVFPDWAQIFFASGVTLGSIVAIILNLLFFHLGPQQAEDDVAVSISGKYVTIDDVNKMEETDFITTFSRLYNGSYWPLERCYKYRPFRDVGELKERLQEVVLTASVAEQNALIDNYPNIGQMLTAGESEAKNISQDIGSLALDLPVDQEEKLVSLSAGYQEKFNMPLVMCLKRHDTAQSIIENALHRMENHPVQERLIALGEVIEVANDRFEIMSADANPVRSAWARKFEQLDS